MTSSAEAEPPRWRFLAPDPREPVAPGAVPTFSVVIAAYNVAPFIREAVASALGQATPPLEVIVCDDGSTDDIDGALAPYRNRITLLHQPNRGQSAAKNAAVRVASGDFVATLDGDDVDLPHRLAALGALAEARPDLDILAGDCEVIEGDRVVGAGYSPTHRFETHDQRRAILERCFVYSPAVRRSRWLAIGGFDEEIRRGPDWDCWIRLILDGSRAGLVDAPLFRYRRWPGQLTGRRVPSLLARVEILEKTRDYPGLSADERDVVERLRRTALLRVAHEAVRSGTPAARELSWRVARDRSFSRAARARAAATALIPDLARRALARRARS